MLTHVGVFSVDFSRIDTGKTVCFLMSGGLSSTGDVFQLVKKVRSDFFDKLRQNRKIKNNILFCNFGRCGG
jgi:hypothetical protein